MVLIIIGGLWWYGGTLQQTPVSTGGQGESSAAASTTVASGAVIDLSGGGDLYVYEFTPGPGGSRDVLAPASSSVTANVFAVLPGYGGAVAPRDFQYGQNGGLRAGDSVYLSGIDGLTAGYYIVYQAGLFKHSRDKKVANQKGFESGGSGLESPRDRP